MEKLIVKHGTNPKEAAKHPSLGLVYQCPKCKVGHGLKHISSSKIECTLCAKHYEKP